MKKTTMVWLTIFSILIVIISSAVYYFLRHPLFLYEKNYFEKIGIKGGRNYENVIANKGEPIKKEINKSFFLAKYDGLELGFADKHPDIKDPPNIMSYAKITGKQYRFGRQKIGVGSTRKKVESVYKHIKKIIHLPDNQFGAIDGGKWVEYTFNEQNIVSEITILVGGGP